jgi:AraC-like DNA-binding protein
MKKHGKEKIILRRIPEMTYFKLVAGISINNDFKKHIHSEYCIGAVTGGRREIIFGDRECSYKTGDIFIINADEAHSNRLINNSYQVMLVEPEVMKNAGENKGKKVYQNAVLGDKELFSSFQTLFKTLNESFPLFEKECGFYSFINLLFKYQITAVEEKKYPDESGKIVGAMQKFIDEKCADKLSLEALSKFAGYSPFYLNRIFCLETGMSPHSYQIHRRVERSKKMLIGNNSIADTALAFGFSDQSHYTKFFKRIVGVTPERFIKLNKK